MSESTKTSGTICPSCAARIHFGKRPHLGDVIVCPECEETFEVVRLEPLKINWSLLDDEPSWADKVTRISKITKTVTTDLLATNETKSQRQTDGFLNALMIAGQYFL